MARRRRGFIARDGHGRFARTGAVYTRRMSTTTKVAIAGGAALAVAAVAAGGYALHREGQKQAYKVGKAHGVYQATPLRNSQGRFDKSVPRIKVGKNPYRGYGTPKIVKVPKAQSAGKSVKAASTRGRTAAQKAVIAGRKANR